MLPVLPTFGISAPLFGGADKLRGKRWLSGREMADYITLRKKPYIGKVPKKLMTELSGQRPGPLYKGLDQLASYIRIHDKPRHIRSLAVNLKNCETRLKLDYLGCGGWGCGYRLQVGEYQGLFKVFHYSRHPLGKLSGAPEVNPFVVEKQGGHGALAEIATGIYLSKWKFGDLARFNVGNPIAGWSLYELLGDHTSLESRPELRLSDRGVAKEDDHDENSTNGVRNDYGGLVPADGNSEKTEELSAPDVLRRREIIENLGTVKASKRFNMLRRNVVDLTSAEDAYRQLDQVLEKQRQFAEEHIGKFLQFNRLKNMAIHER